MKKTSYRIDSYKFSRNEGQLLKKRSNFRIEEFVNAVFKLKVPVKAHILEIGSGTGHRAAMMAKNFRSSAVLGLDISEEMTNQARKHHSGVPNLLFEKNDIRAFALNSQKASFDLIYLRLVLQHTSSPEEVVGICHKLLKNGGYLVVEDVDRHMMTFYPTHPDWKKLYSNAIKTHKLCGGDPHVGSKLSHFLERASFRKVDDLSYLHCGDQKFFNEWTDTFAPSFFNNLNQNERKLALQCLKTMKLQNEKVPRSFAQMWFLYVAKK